MATVSVRGPRTSRWARVKASMSPEEWRRAGYMAAVIAGLHVIGFGILILVVAPAKYKLGASGTFAIGTGITAYTLGMRHAFDADHISAIDNTTRKFMSEGKRPLSVGFFFSLGHSTIVFGAGVPDRDRGQGARRPGPQHRFDAAQGDQRHRHRRVGRVPLHHRDPQHHHPRQHREDLPARCGRGRFNEAELEAELNSRGLMNRLFGKRLNKIQEPWQMYPVGVLFGLGFDTATEVALLVIAGSAGAAGLPFYAIICLPVLFAAGMSLLDTIDGSFMNFAYGWAFSKPVRKVYYNITITGLSVAVALFIGTIELVGLLTQKLGWTGSSSTGFRTSTSTRPASSSSPCSWAPG